MKLSTIISNYRKKFGLSLRAFAAMSDCSFQYIDRIEKDLISNPSIQSLKKIAEAMNKSLDDLLREMDDTIIDIELPNYEPITEVSIYSLLCCGNGMFVEDNIISKTSIPTSLLPKGKKEFFAQYASGDSMIDRNIYDGDLLIFSKEQCESGDIGCFCIDENVATCKILKIVDNQIILVPANNNYEPIIVDPFKFKCVGKLVLTMNKR